MKNAGTQVTLIEQHYNRNGVGGESFYSVKFSLKEDGVVTAGLLAIVPEASLVGFLNANLRECKLTVAQFEDSFGDRADAAGDWDAHVYVVTPFALESKWRGDRLAHDVCTELWGAVRASYGVKS